jgi:serine/threonine protein phosphatase PrpC
MKVRSLIRRGFDHKIHCEDFISLNDGGRYFIGGVFDGCSGGRETHFASTLFAKIFRLILDDNGFVNGTTIEGRSKEFMRTFVSKLFEVRVSLGLIPNDLVSTFIMIVYDKVHGEALVLSVGDGLIHCDNETIVLENTRFMDNNPEKYEGMPDYIAYDLDDIGLDKSYFDVWFDRNVIKHKFVNPQDISICTDGIFTFNTPELEVDPISFLIEDENWSKNEIMLSKKVNILGTKYKTVHKDDLTIIRLILKEDEND